MGEFTNGSRTPDCIKHQRDCLVYLRVGHGFRTRRRRIHDPGPSIDCMKGSLDSGGGLPTNGRFAGTWRTDDERGAEFEIRGSHYGAISCLQVMQMGVLG